MQHTDFVRFVGMIGDAVGFDEVYIPTGVELYDGVVIGLSGGVGFYSPVVSVPWTDVGLIGCIRSVISGIGDGRVHGYSFAGDAADDVEAKFQTKRVNIV